MINYCRTDLCPDCGKRFRDIHYEHNPKYVGDIISDFPLWMQYKDKYYTTIKCFGCHSLWTKREVLDYWSEYLMKDND